MARSGAGPVGLGYVWLRLATFSGTDAVSLHGWQGALLARDGGRQVRQVTPERTADVATNVASCTKRTFTHGARRSMVPPDPSGPPNPC